MLLAELWIFFKQFGLITNILIDERKQACTVHFKNIASAEAAATKPGLSIGESKLEIIYNTGGIAQKPDSSIASEAVQSPVKDSKVSKQSEEERRQDEI